MALKQPSAAVKRITKLLDTPNENRIDLALALAKLEEAKPGTLAALGNARPSERRTLYYLLDVGRWLTPLGQPKSRLARIGWTKLAILAEYSGPLSPHSLLAQAEKHTAAELPAILKAGLHAKVPEKRRAVMLRLTNAQYAIFEAAVLAHGAVKAGKGKGLVDKEAGLIAALQKLSPMS